MEFIRTILIALVLFLSYTLYESWNKEHHPVESQVSISKESKTNNSNVTSGSNDVPTIKDSTSNQSLSGNIESSSSSDNYITVKTNNLVLKYFELASCYSLDPDPRILDADPKHFER